MTPDPHVQLLDDARHAAAVAERTQRRLLADAEEQDATFRGSLEQLAETGAEVVLHTAVGRRLRGAVRALTADHVLLVGDHGRAWVRIASVTVVRVGAGSLAAGGGDRPTRAAVALADAVRDLAEQRATVEVLFDGGGGIRGTAVAAGRDLLTLRDGRGEHALAHLDRAAIVLTTDA